MREVIEMFLEELAEETFTEFIGVQQISPTRN